MPAPIVLSQQPTVFNQFLAELRDADIQQDRLRFRHNLRRVGQILAYELSRLLPYATEEVVTPLGQLEMDLPADQPVVAAILRAALPLQDGFLDIFDHADAAFVSAYRRHLHNSDEFTIQIEYLSSPQLTDRILVVLDPMIATGRSMLQSYEALVRQHGTPERVFLCGVIASEEAVDYLSRHLPDAQIIVGAVDAELTSRGYIVPGLGDAGDLAYGEKS